jgi:hypothetical protein
MKDLTDEDLFKPLSAKVGRREYVPGGREKTSERAGQGRKWQAFLRRRAKDAELRARGGPK